MELQNKDEDSKSSIKVEGAEGSADEKESDLYSDCEVLRRG